MSQEKKESWVIWVCECLVYWEGGGAKMQTWSGRVAVRESHGKVKGTAWARQRQFFCGLFLGPILFQIF